MSRRAPAAVDTTERNRAALKTLTKLDSNKLCADCKRNKHPRWASWNLGVFVCIRCSGIHRSLGVHISRVKSIDLDSWTDEQLASMVKWGNKRANRYWEHKLAEGHVPNEGKIESFIRTKYDSRRWAMEGPVPSDPATLDGEEGDDDVPLKVVQERARASSGTQGQQRNGSGALPQPPRVRPQDVDLFGDSVEAAPVRPSTTEPAVQRPGPPKAPVAAPKQTRAGESLLGFDFFGGTQSAPPQRPSSTGPTTPRMPGRTDLKQSILSLYASKPAAPPQPQATSNVDMFGGMQSPPLSSPGHQQQSNAQSLGGLGDAFGSLSFSSPQPTQATAKPSAFSGLASPTNNTRQASNPLSGGSFFDAKPAPPPKQTTSPPMQKARQPSFGGDFGDFSSAIASPTTNKSPPPPGGGGSMGGMNDLFDLSSTSAPAPPPKPTAAPTAAKSPPPLQASNFSSAFNLSSPTQPSAPKPAPPQTSSAAGFGGMSNMDPWGSNNAWATPDPAPAPAPTRTQPAPPAQTQMSSFSKPAHAPAPIQSKMESPFDSGWGDAEPAAPARPAATSTSSGFGQSNNGGFGQSQSSGFGQTQSAGGLDVQQDEEFGGWSHASPVATTSGPKQGGLGGNADDLFGNVWE